MQLLVSVRNASEAEAALAGGADIVDAKEPLNGPLGPVSPAVLGAIASVVGDRRPVSAALGDVARDNIADATWAAMHARATFVKIGLAGLRGHLNRAPDLLATAGVKRTDSLVLVAYADYDKAEAPPLDDVIALAKRVSAGGVLLDTYDKEGPGLTTLMTPNALRDFVTCARSAGRMIALAGRLSAADLTRIHVTGADIAGIRGAGCDGGRAGVVTAARVRALRLALPSD
jgi:uncharacterized protein (UPF0264 family)